MFGMPILDVTIGLLFCYLLLSLIVTACNELIETIIKLRGAHLAKGVRKLLGDGKAKEFFKHGLIKGLCPDKWFGQGARMPSYLPAPVFSSAVFDLLVGLNAAAPKTIQDVRTAIGNLPAGDYKQALLALLEDAQNSLDHFRKNLETWFNTQMERVGGWYKRKVQLVTLGLAAGLAVGANADSIVMARALWNDAALRGALVKQAEELVDQVKTPAKSDGAAKKQEGQADIQVEFETRLKVLNERINRLQGLGLPIGWTHRPVTVVWWEALLGWIVTALAISLGAPFWFDLLSKVITIRAAGKVPPKA